MQDKTVLVIEDNELNMKFARTLLEIGGYTVIEAIDAETGIRLIREHQPDMILMDLQLPGMDGLSATRLIKSDPVLQDIPVIALTAYAMSRDEEKAKEVGCAGSITKPVDPKSFLETVARYLQQDTPKE